MRKFDPERAFKIGPMNGREGRGSGLRLKASAAQERLYLGCANILSKVERSIGVGMRYESAKRKLVVKA